MGLVCSRKSKFTVGEGDTGNDADAEGSTPLTLEDMYLKAEFTAMDRDKDGLLTVKEWLDLIRFLGYYGKMDYMGMLGRERSDDNPYVTIDEYLKALKDDAYVMEGTGRLREVFRQFDKDSSGSARKKDILKELGKMGCHMDEELKAKIETMDTNKDGRIQYIEFLESEFKKLE